MGKTPLALEVGAALTGTFDRVVMVLLDQVSSVDLVVSSIASSLGVPEFPRPVPAGPGHQLPTHSQNAADHRQLRARGGCRRSA
jgi:hypothetical protein